jgi:hypothetical protein
MNHFSIYIGEVIVEKGNKLIFTTKKANIRLNLTNIRIADETEHNVRVMNFDRNFGIRKDDGDSNIILYSLGETIKIIFDKNSSSGYNDFMSKIQEYLKLSFTKLYDSNNKLRYHGYILDNLPHIEGEYYYPTGYIKYKGMIDNDNFDGKGMFITRDGKGILEVNNISNGIIIGKGSMVYLDKKVIIDFDDYYKQKNLIEKINKREFTKNDEFLEHILRDFELIKPEIKQEQEQKDNTLIIIDKKIDSIYQLIIMTTILNILLHLIL